MSEPKKDCGNWVRFVKTGASGLARAITGLRGDLTSSWANLPLRLCGLFRPLALAKSHAGAATVLVNEFDTSDLERTSYDLKGSSTRLTGPSLKLVHCYDAHARALGQFLLLHPAVPAVYEWREFVVAEGLRSYGSAITENRGAQRCLIKLKFGQRLRPRNVH